MVPHKYGSFLLWKSVESVFLITSEEIDKVHELFTLQIQFFSRYFWISLDQDSQSHYPSVDT